MQRDLTDAEFLDELEHVAEENLNHHLAVAKEWHPHDYVPWTGAATSRHSEATTGTPSNRS